MKLEWRRESLPPKINLASMLSKFRDCGGRLLLAYGSSLSPPGVNGLLYCVGGVTVPEPDTGVSAGLLSRDGDTDSLAGPTMNPGEISLVTAALDNMSAGRVEIWPDDEGLGRLEIGVPLRLLRCSARSGGAFCKAEVWGVTCSAETSGRALWTSLPADPDGVNGGVCMDRVDGTRLCDVASEL